MSLKKLAKLLTNKKVLKVGMMVLSHPKARKTALKGAKTLAKKLKK